MTILKLNSEIHQWGENHDSLRIGHKSFNSRLMLGTGKYKDITSAKESIHNSEAAIVTVAVRRLQNFQLINQNHLLYNLPWKSLWFLPNTAGCTTAEEAIRIASLGREICKKLGQVDNSFIKLEVIPDCKYLFPDPLGTLKAAEYLVSKKFTVLPYINSDPMLAKQLEEIGCSTVMPLGSPIGSGKGLKNIENLKVIIENSKIPVVIDAGIGTASDAVKAMELGADAVLVNSAIAHAKNPQLMALSVNWGVKSGRIAYAAGRMQALDHAKPSSPLIGLSS